MAEREARVEFYSLFTQDGSEWQLAKAYEILRDMEQSARYMPVDQRHICVYPPAAGENRGQLCWVRFDDRPPVDSGGQLGDLNLPEGAGLADVSLFVVFEGRFIGVIRTLHSPGITRLTEYITTKLSAAGLPSATIDALVSPQAAKKLEGATELRKVTLKVRRSAIQQLQDTTFEDALTGGVALDDDATEVELSISTRKAGGLSSGLLQRVRSLASSSPFTDNTETFKLRVRTEDGDLDTINVLDDRLTQQVKVDVTAAGKRLDAESAYRAIQGAYEHLKDELEAAVPISS